MSIDVVDTHFMAVRPVVPLSDLSEVSDEEQIDNNTEKSRAKSIRGSDDDETPVGYQKVLEVVTTRPVSEAGQGADIAGNRDTAQVRDRRDCIEQLNQPVPLVRQAGSDAKAAVVARHEQPDKSATETTVPTGPTCAPTAGLNMNTNTTLELTSLVARWRIPSSEVFLDPSQMLGRGNYGVVFAGRCRGSDVAVKRLNAGAVSGHATSARAPASEFDVRLLRSLLAEADAMSKAQNPHVLLLLGVVVEPGNVALVTELMPRGSLEDLLRAARPPRSATASALLQGFTPEAPGAGSNDGGHPASQALASDRRAFMSSSWSRAQLVRDAARGLCWLHGKGIIHRDLKPQNLLVDRGWRVKVCDFGFSIQLAVRGAWSDASPRGSPIYMAPECLRGQSFNAASDMYSLGCIAWEVLTLGILFPRVINEHQLRAAVCERHERPPLGADLTAAPNASWYAKWAIPAEGRVGRLLRASWAPSALARCSADTFVAKFEEAAIEYVLGDSALPGAGGEDAVRFWIRVTNSSRVNSADSGPLFAYWADVRVELERAWCAASDETPEAVWHAIQALCELPCSTGVAAASSADNMVSINKFAELLQWFGPLDRLVACVNAVVVGPSSEDSSVCAFHARLSKEEADNMLMDTTKPIGSFLLRFSSGPGSFVLSCSASPQDRSASFADRSVLHFRVAYDSGHYVFDGRHYSSLIAFVEAVRAQFGLKLPLAAPALVPRVLRVARGITRSGYEDHMPSK